MARSKKFKNTDLMQNVLKHFAQVWTPLPKADNPSRE